MFDTKKRMIQGFLAVFSLACCQTPEPGDLLNSL